MPACGRAMAAALAPTSPVAGSIEILACPLPRVSKKNIFGVQISSATFCRIRYVYADAQIA